VLLRLTSAALAVQSPAGTLCDWIATWTWMPRRASCIICRNVVLTGGNVSSWPIVTGRLEPEVVRLADMPVHHDGEWIRLKQFGAYVRSSGIAVDERDDRSPLVWRWSSAF